MLWLVWFAKTSLCLFTKLGRRRVMYGQVRAARTLVEQSGAGRAIQSDRQARRRRRLGSTMHVPRCSDTPVESFSLTFTQLLHRSNNSCKSPTSIAVLASCNNYSESHTTSREYLIIACKPPIATAGAFPCRRRMLYKLGIHVHASSADKN